MSINIRTYVLVVPTVGWWGGMRIVISTWNISCGSRSHMLDARSIYLYISYVGTRRNKSTPVSDEGGSMFHAELIVSKEEGSCSLRTAGNNMAANIYIHNIHHTHEWIITCAGNKYLNERVHVARWAVWCHLSEILIGDHCRNGKVIDEKHWSYRKRQ